LLTVNKGIFKLWASPDASFVFLSILVSLSVAILLEGRTIVERVDLLPAFASLPGLVTRCLESRVKNLDGLGWYYMSRNGRWYRRYRSWITWDVAIEAMCLGITSGLPQRLPTTTINAPPCVHVLWRMWDPL
jgi:hypothetical protein